MKEIWLLLNVISMLKHHCDRLRPIVEALPYTKGYLSVCSEFNYNKYNKIFPGQIGNTYAQLDLLNKDQRQVEAINDWRKAISNVLMKNKNPELCFYQIREINDTILCDPRISIMIPSYLSMSPIDDQFCLITQNSELLFNIKNFANPRNIDIDLVIPEAQIVNVDAIDGYFIDIANLFNKSIAQDLITNYMKVKTLTCI
jgi:hypothetical protein